MSATNTESTVAELLDRLVTDAVSLDVPLPVAKEARAAVSRDVRVAAGPMSGQTARRVEAYFSAVVRRRVVRRSSSPRAAARFVVASVVEDLRSTGRSGADIWDELERGWAQRIPDDVLEEYRLRLCG